jgi:GWxTD domain-containing protein
VDSLFQTALAQAGRVPARESLKAFERVLKVDRNYAPAHYEMAKLYMSLNTVADRQQARYALDRALKLEPENASYQLTLGDLLWAQGLWSNAVEQYEKAFQEHPQNAQAAYKIGYYALKHFLKYQLMVNEEGRKWEHFGEGYREKAITYLERGIELDAGFRDTYYQLGVVHLESKQPRMLIHVAEQLLKQYPGDKDALLFCGLGYQATGNQERAYGFYTEAIKRMDSEERAMMESVDLIATQEEQQQIGQAEAQSQEGDSIKGWRDSLERGRFWRKHDPLFLTAFNERRMEHYSRVAYANLRFSRPSKGIKGWQTDMGKTYIKFGQPIHQIAKRPYIEVPKDLDKDPTLYYYHLETWFYEGFGITFINEDGLDGWHFSTGDDYTWTASNIKVRQKMNLEYKPGVSAIGTFKNTPPRYVDPYRDKKYSLPHQIAAFRSGDSVRVELSYAIPKARLKVSYPEGVVELEDGVFLFDENWEEIYRKPSRPVSLQWPEFGSQGRTEADSLRRNYLFSSSTVYVKPGAHHVAAEVQDKGAGSVGTFRELRTFSFADTALSMSDLLLASRIKPRTPSPESRKDLEITSNPLRAFHRAWFVSVYFEVYNLTRDESGRTEYDVSYRIGRPEKKEVDPALFAALDAPEAHGRVEVERVIREEPDDPERIWERSGGPVEYRVRYVLPERNRISDQIEKIERGERGAEIAVTARYAGERRDDLAYLQVDVGQMPRGVYRLTVAIRDVRTGWTAEREALFRVVE